MYAYEIIMIGAIQLPSIFILSVHPSLEKWDESLISVSL